MVCFRLYFIRLVYTGGKGIVKVWDMQSSSPVNVARLECLDNYIRACLITRDGAMLIVGGEAGHIVVADVSGNNAANPVIIGRLMTPKQLTYALAVSRDSRFLFSCCSE
jgi:hypothetical protein